MQNTDEIYNPDDALESCDYCEDIVKEAPKNKNKKKKELVPVFRSVFLIDSQMIEKKDIKNYIFGRALPALGDDYYYGYIYKDNILSFIALQSCSFDVGKISVFTPAFLKPGIYFYQDGMKYYVVTHGDDGFMKNVVSYERPAEGVDLTDFNYEEIGEDIPHTLHLEWTLVKHQRPVTLVLLGIFVLALIFFGLSAQSYSDVSKQANLLGKQANSKTDAVSNQLPDITQVVKECAEKIGERGTIRQVALEKDTIIFLINFSSENDARDFMKVNGGKYENNQVILALVVANSGQPGNGK